MTSKRFIQIFLAIIFALIVVGAIFAIVARGAPSAQATPYPPNYPPAKQTFEASIQQTRTAASNRPQPPPGPTPVPITPTSAPIVRQPSGGGFIVADFVSPFPAMSHVITNMWYEENASQRSIVYAGGLRDEPGVTTAASQGVVIVQVETLDHEPLPGGGTFSTPTKVGVVTIVNARGERLMLQSINGTIFYFDVPTRQFVSSP
ncbi:MAG: hypothetical protein HZB51_31020 [Chloroflexi bacterium]|nr:hypothetical protein [Chloroflexota bacterium]